jgi:hypothetical protein
MMTMAWVGFKVSTTMLQVEVIAAGEHLSSLKCKILGRKEKSRQGVGRRGRLRRGRVKETMMMLMRFVDALQAIAALAPPSSVSAYVVVTILFPFFSLMYV